jgi:hypothetical protein
VARLGLADGGALILILALRFCPRRERETVLGQASRTGLRGEGSSKKVPQRRPVGEGLLEKADGRRSLGEGLVGEGPPTKARPEKVHRRRSREKVWIEGLG